MTDLECRYVIIESGKVTGSVVVIGERPGRGAQAWRDANRPGAVMAVVVGGDDETWLAKLPSFRSAT